MGKKYIKCPRCELNYILEGEDYCHVCKSEMKHHTEVDEDELLDFDDLDLCPVCGANFVKENETMCNECRAKLKGEKSQDWDDEEEDSSLVATDADETEGDDYNSGFSDIDPTSEDIDPYKIEDDVDIDEASDESLDFAVEEETEETFDDVEEAEDTFETVEITDEDDEEDDEDDDEDYDFDEDDDMLGSHK